MQVDQAHGQLNGPATRQLPEREFQVFGQVKYERLSTIPVAADYPEAQRA